MFILLICSSKEKKKPLPLTNNQVLKKRKLSIKDGEKEAKDEEGKR